MNNIPIVDKMAVVFHGIVGGMAGRNNLGEPINIVDCAKLIRHNVLSLHDCDVFIHSWSAEHQDLLVSLYNPTKFLFQQQEMFGYSFSNQAFKDEHKTLNFRTFSKYTSLERAVELKKQHEIENNFKYKWVLILRFDLVFFSKLILDNLDPSHFYVCSEPHWVNRPDLKVIHDILFLSGSGVIDIFSDISRELREGIYNDTLHAAHEMAYRKLMSMYDNDVSKVKNVFDRYKDIEVYRFVVNPDQNPVGHAYGALETKHKLEQLLKEI